LVSSLSGLSFFWRPQQEDIPPNRNRDAVDMPQLLEGGDGNEDQSKDEGEPANHRISFPLLMQAFACLIGKVP
jgi:hypothetical protein